jgi:hypothetical protein
MSAPSAPLYASILLNHDRVIFGSDFLEDSRSPATRALPGIDTLPPTGYLPTDIYRNLRWTLQKDTNRWVCGPRYATEEEGWIHTPTARVAKKHTRASERRKERQGWLGSLTERVTELPPL